MNYTDDRMNKSRNSIITQLGGIWLFLEDCPTHHQNKYFQDFIEQRIEDWQEDQDSQENVERKPMKEFSKPEVLKIGSSYFFIAGTDQIFLLNHEYNKETELNFFSRKLSEEDIANLDVDIIWTGIKRFDFCDDEEEAFSLLNLIITKMNLMQEEEVYSFPLGNLY